MCNLLAVCHSSAASFSVALKLAFEYLATADAPAASSVRVPPERKLVKFDFFFLYFAQSLARHQKFARPLWFHQLCELMRRSQAAVPAAAISSLCAASLKVESALWSGGRADAHWTSCNTTARLRVAADNAPRTGRADVRLGGNKPKGVPFSDRPEARPVACLRSGWRVAHLLTGVLQGHHEGTCRLASAPCGPLIPLEGGGAGHLEWRLTLERARRTAPGWKMSPERVAVCRRCRSGHWNGRARKSDWPR